MRGWPVLACGILLVGCGRSAFMEVGRHAGGAVLFLPGAGEEAAGPDDFVEEAEGPAPVEPEPARPAEPPKEEPPERRAIGLGVRAGAMLPGTGKKEDYLTGLMLGLFWRPGRNGSRLGYELELAYRQGESESGLEQRRLIAGHANGLWHFARNEVLSAYALGGLGLVSETVEDEELGTSSTLGSSMDFGVGVTVSGVDARVTYSILLGSENVGGAFGASLGYVF